MLQGTQGQIQPSCGFNPAAFCTGWPPREHPCHWPLPLATWDRAVCCWHKMKPLRRGGRELEQQTSLSPLSHPILASKAFPPLPEEG